MAISRNLLLIIFYQQTDGISIPFLKFLLIFFKILWLFTFADVFRRTDRRDFERNDLSEYAFLTVRSLALLGMPWGGDGKTNPRRMKSKRILFYFAGEFRNFFKPF